MSTENLSSSTSELPFFTTDLKTTRHTVKGNLHFIINPSTAVPSPSSNNSSSTLAFFDTVVRNVDLQPILSRLPLKEHHPSEKDLMLTDPLDYIPGEKVWYTQSRLPTIDSESWQLWKSLHSFRPLTSEYALGYVFPIENVVSPDSSTNQCPVLFSAPHSKQERSAVHLIQSRFNWNSLPPLPIQIQRVWYGVLFRSVRKKASESIGFYEADRLAHEEAVQSGGLLMYWYGVPNHQTGENVATCIWTDRAEAIRASRLELHAIAAKLSAKAYDTYQLTRYKVSKVKGETGLRIEEWD